MFIIFISHFSPQKKVKKDRKREKGKDASSSLVVAALKRLLPVGLNLFAGREQELVQHSKDRFLMVRSKGFWSITNSGEMASYFF